VPAAEFALSLADLDANHDDYGGAHVRLELCAEQAPLPVAYKRKRTCWIRGPAEGRGAPARAPAVAGDRRADPRLDLAASGLLQPELRARFGGVLCEVVDVQRPQRLAQIPFPGIA
jgi:hypothetical protein